MGSIAVARCSHGLPGVARLRLPAFHLRRVDEQERRILPELRELEDAVAKQRRFIGDLKAQGLDTDAERERLGELLCELENTPRAGNATMPD
jgi:hypothetical protein